MTTTSPSQPHRPPVRRVTAADVARAVGVSKTTVSLVLNGRAKRHRISDHTVREVEHAAQKLDYAPNDLARSLRNSQTGEVGVMLPHLRNDWAHHIMLGIESVLDDAGMVPYIVNHHEDAERHARGLEALARRRVDGILCSPLQAEAAHYDRMAKRGIPLVFLGDAPSGAEDARFAAWDPEEIAAPVRHLLEGGRKRILFLGQQEDDRRLGLERHEVVRRVLREAGAPTDDRFWFIRSRREGFASSIASAFTERPPEERPDAVFTLYDDIAMSVMDQLLSLGLRIPDEVAVAATGTGLELGCRAYGLTVMVAPVQREGEAAARLLWEQIQSPTTPAESTRVRGGQLQIGRSSDATAQPPPWAVVPDMGREDESGRPRARK